MKNKGCLSVATVALGFVIGLYALMRLIHFILVPKTAKGLAFFHESIVSLQPYYTTLAGGTLGARLITTLMLTTVLWLLIWIAMRGLASALNKEALKQKIEEKALWLLLIFIIPGILLNIFVPGRLIVFDQENRSINISNYGSLLLFLPNPIVEEEYQIPFDQIDSFHYSLETELVRGASHDVAFLYAVTTQSDTLLVGKNQVRHGEFGWIVDWRSKEKRLADSRERAEKVVNTLNQLIKGP